MTNFDIFFSTPQFEPFSSVTLSAQCAHWAPLPRGEARGLPQDGGLP